MGQVMKHSSPLFASSNRKGDGSCFEDFNGELRSLLHGTQSIEEQIVLVIIVQQKFHS